MNRTLKHVGDVLEYSADDKHEKAIRAEFGIVAGSKVLDAPAEKNELDRDFDEERDDPELDKEREGDTVL